MCHVWESKLQVDSGCACDRGTEVYIEVRRQTIHELNPERGVWSSDMGIEDTDNETSGGA